MEKEFVAEFLVHDVTTTAPYIARPAIAIRLLEFPTLLIDGRSEERLVFGKGKACKFRIDAETLKSALRKLPLYVMLMDVHAPNIKMLATAALDLSLFAEKPFPESTDFRRSRVDLYDPVRNPVAKVDISISFLMVPEVKSVVSVPADSIFKTITEDDIRKSLVPTETKVSMAVGTEAIPSPGPVKTTMSQGTMTQDPEVAPRSVQTETSVFEQVNQPPPMFFSKPTKYGGRENAKETSLPVVPKTVYVPTPSREGVLDDLLNELVALKERSKLSQATSYPPVIQFEQPGKASVALSTQHVSQLEIVSPPHFDQSPIDTTRSKAIKTSVEDYSSDFEEEKSVSIRTSQSTEQTIKCYLCGESLKISEAGAHAKKCKRLRIKDSFSLSPRSSSIEEQIEASHVSKPVEKSLSQTSMIAEYEEDFEDASSSLK